MARTLKEVIEEWERERMVTVGTIAHVKSGRPVKPATAYQIAKALGCTEEEARALADAGPSQAEVRQKQTA